MSNVVSNTFANTHVRNAPSLWLFLASLCALALAGYPIYVIRPFREQAPAALDSALWVLLHNKLPPLITALAVTTLALLAWHRAGWISRLFLVPSIFFVILGAVSASVNPYEHMFHPFGEPRCIAAQQASIDISDMVIAITLGGESRAYPNLRRKDPVTSPQNQSGSATGEAGAADGRQLIETSMGSVPVVVMDPREQVLSSLL